MNYSFKNEKYSRRKENTKIDKKCNSPVYNAALKCLRINFSIRRNINLNNREFNVIYELNNQPV